jgi:hypothetical protein
MEEFTKSGLSQADLARRLGKGTDIVCRLLGGPGNWTLDTLSDLMFAISGAAPVFSKDYPLNKPFTTIKIQRLIRLTQRMMSIRPQVGRI